MRNFIIFFSSFLKSDWLSQMTILLCDTSLIILYTIPCRDNKRKEKLIIPSAPFGPAGPCGPAGPETKQFKS